ncbi:hypothetical protein Gotri_025835 [Gossypium trilobum]|uniref:DUF7745 domain-containing protein n=2 Tax=Gossypium trilobum TaxID=34281 RepID=A0A7J9FI50_9ROSI|nr:hypothetical protein [Gossypium trilobum]
MTQNSLQELKEIWEQWDNGIKQLFYSNYGDLSFLLDIKVGKRLFRALAQYWNPAYSCFTFGKVDLVPTVEEYMTLLRCLRTQIDKAYSRAGNVPTFLKKLMCITGMSEQWVVARIKQKGDSKCIPWKNLRDLILAHPDVKKRVDIFSLSIYGLVIFPKALGHVDEAISDLFDRLDKGVTPVPTILAETFRSLNVCQRTGEGRFIGCAQLLLDFDWVPLLGLWRAVGYTFLLLLRQYGSRQFIPETQGLAQYIDIHKLEAEKLRKWKNKAEEDLDSLKTDYKKLRLSIRTAGLGKTSEQWRQEIKEEKTKADQWETKFQDARARESALEKNLLECRNEEVKLKAQVAELEKSLHLYRSRGSMIELRASLSKIKELKGKIEVVEDALQNSELRVELLERGNEQCQEQLFHSQSQIRDKDYIMGEVVTQVREVANNLQSLAVRADVLSLKYELESDRGRELA